MNATHGDYPVRILTVTLTLPDLAPNHWGVLGPSYAQRSGGGLGRAPFPPTFFLRLETCKIDEPLRILIVTLTLPDLAPNHWGLLGPLLRTAVRGGVWAGLPFPQTFFLRLETCKIDEPLRILTVTLTLPDLAPNHCGLLGPLLRTAVRGGSGPGPPSPRLSFCV